MDTVDDLASLLVPQISKQIAEILRKLNPKKNEPTSRVLSGVSEFRIDTIELSIFWTAKANIKAGKNDPIKAVIAI